MTTGGKGALLAWSAVAIAVGGAAASASAQSATPLAKADFIAQADAICKAETVTQKREARSLSHRLKTKNIPDFDEEDAAEVVEAIKKSKGVRNGYRAVGRIYIRFGNLDDDATDALAALIPPPEDAALVTRWLDSRRILAGSMRSLGRGEAALANHPTRRSFKRSLKRVKHFVFRLFKTSDIVGAYGFEECAPYSEDEEPVGEEGQW